MVGMKKQRSFADKVRDVVRNIPRGKVMTYAEVARKAGNPKEIGRASCRERV